MSQNHNVANLLDGAQKPSSKWIAGNHEHVSGGAVGDAGRDAGIDAGIDPADTVAGERHNNAGRRTRDSSGGSRLENLFTTLLFVGIILFLSLASVYSCVTTKQQVLVAENRSLAPFPRLRNARKDLPQFATGFESYFNDRFIDRLRIIAVRNLINLRVFASSGHPRVAIGRNDWFYYIAPGMLESQLNTESFSDANLKLWAKMLQSRHDLLAQHNIKYVFVIAPEKGTIYPEYLPAGWYRRPGKTRLDQLQEYLQKNSNIDFVDAKSILLTKKSKGQLIYHTKDTHWNSVGGFTVSQEILKRVSAYLPLVQPFSPQDYRVVPGPFKGDLTKMLGLGPELTETCPTVEMIRKLTSYIKYDAKLPFIANCQEPAFAMEQEDTRLPRAFMLRDSFAGYLWPFIAERFHFAEFQWTHQFIPKLILGEKPDVVIDEIAERHLYDYEADNVPDFLVAGKRVTTAQAATSGGAEKIGETITDKFNIPVLANYSNRVELLDMTMQPTQNEMLLKLHWRSPIKQKLDLEVGIHAVRADGEIAGTRDYPQDGFRREVEAGSEWLDTLAFPKSKMADATQFGVVVYPDDTKACLPATAKKTDWGVIRVLLPLR
jgi:alginate O-acetyltransferase complex protein AlgJ